MNTKYTQYVLTIAREGSITAASRKLCVTQPALSQTLKLIERDLGVEIFDRSTDPISLTFAGRRYIDAALRVAEIERGLMADLQDANAEVRGLIRVGVSMECGFQIMPRIIPRFRKRYPLVGVELLERPNAQLERMTLEGKCDFALIEAEQASAKLDCMLLGQEEMVLMASRMTRLAKRIKNGTPIDIREAKNEHFVSMCLESDIRHIQDRLFARSQINPEILFETANMGTAECIAALSDAVMLIPQAFAMGMAEIRKRVHLYPILGQEQARGIYLCARKGMHQTKYMEAFSESLLGELRVEGMACEEGACSVG